MRIIVFVSIGALLWSACGTRPGDGDVAPGDFSARHMVAEDYVQEVDSLRMHLVRLLANQDVTEATFQDVCQPVAERMEGLSRETGWEISQQATRFRNPAHRSDHLATEMIVRFTERSELQSVWEKVVREDGMTGWRYFEKIEVEPACLACHGSESQRLPILSSPLFSTEYPVDEAIDFQPGDIQGVYSVFVPDSTAV